MLLKEITTVYTENHTRIINTNSVTDFKAGGACIAHWALSYIYYPSIPLDIFLSCLMELSQL
jgi:hypothetical protein